MLFSPSARPICGSCRQYLTTVFNSGFSSLPPLVSHRRAVPKRSLIFTKQGTRTLHLSCNRYGADSTKTHTSTLSGDVPIKRSVTEMESLVRQARRTFGDTLPADFLSADEYKIYERLYGVPLRETTAEDAELLQPLAKNIEDEQEAEELELGRNALLKENAEGNLEEVDYVEDPLLDEEENPPANDSDTTQDSSSDFKARDTLFQDIAIALKKVDLRNKFSQANDEYENSAKPDSEKLEFFEGKEEDEGPETGEFEDGYIIENNIRTHPLSAAGRFSTSPTTLFLPKDTFVNPITSLLADSSNKQLAEMAHRIFGGPRLPNSVATPRSKAGLRQQPIALEASQFKMGEMEANLYLAAIMPGTYAAITSTLVETRKRLGSTWLTELLGKSEGPRILDAGAAGAGVLAWHEILRAEWERMHPDGTPDGESIPFGKATVITGSPELRRRSSLLLEDTTFLPRLPDYDAARDLPKPTDGEPPTRKQYDVILAPHTLWTLKEDYMRKAQIQNLWSLLNPKGGVLIVIEKGVPRGFELVAGAREVLLKNQISSPGSASLENQIQDQSSSRFTEKEEGFIIAPCTNHVQCPMYTVTGQSKGRKDHCHFSQRFIRPPYLQRIIGENERNHESVRFSYIAVRRGRDKRRTGNVQQNDTATKSAFAGYGVEDLASARDPDDRSLQRDDECDPLMLSLPRAILPPLKRTGHVSLDLCTPSGTLERWTVPKSFSKQAYRDARKSQWGDLWALGAKTRVLRNVRAGTGKDGKKPKRIIEVGIGANESEDTLRDISRKGQYDRRTKRGRKEKNPKPLREADL